MKSKNKILTLFFTFCALYSFAPVQAQQENPLSSSDSAEFPGNDEEILSGPFSEYGEFDSSEDEAEDERFFQYGRFFGIGLGIGNTTPTGNAGKLYQGGFPTVDFRISYWFDFNFALNVNVQNSTHSYDVAPDGLTSVNFFRLLMQIKYYFDTRNLSAPITFVGPHLIAGGGLYRRTDNIGSGTGDATIANTIESVNAFGFNFGAGFELTLKPKKTYLQLEALVHMVSFRDQLDPRFRESGIRDRTGAWITTVLAIMWTW